MPAATTIKLPVFDAVLGRHPMMSCIVQSGDAKEIISAKKFQDLVQIIYPLLRVVNKNHVTAHHDTAQHFVNTCAMADKYIRAHPDEVRDIYTRTVRKAGAKLDENIFKTMMFKVP